MLWCLVLSAMETVYQQSSQKVFTPVFQPFSIPPAWNLLHPPNTFNSTFNVNFEYLNEPKNLELTPFLLAALQAVDQATEESDEAICLLCAKLPLLSSSCSSHEVCERLTVVLLVVVKDKGRRSGTSEGSLCNQVSDVQGVAHSWDIVAQEH